MKKALLALALLQAPTPTPVPLTYQNDPARPIAIWKDDGKGGIWTNVKPLPTPKAAATPLSVTGCPPRWTLYNSAGTIACKPPEVQIDKGDEPVGPCNLGDLVRAAQAHLDREHPVVDEWMGAGGTTYMQTLAYKYCDHNPNTPACQVQRAEEALARAKAVQDAEVKRLTILNTLRAELARCSPAKGGGK